MKFKKASVDFVVISGFVAVVIVGFIAMAQIINISTSEGTASRLQQSIADSERAIQGVRQVFEQTAIFFGLMNTAKELGAHGGVSAATAAVPATFAPNMQVGSGIAYWAVARCDNTAGNPTSVIRKRTPYLLNEDYNISVNSVSASALLVDEEKYSQNLEEAMNGGYNFHAGVQVLMMKPGTVTLTVCQPSKCSIPADTIVQTTSSSGSVVISFGSNVVKSNAEDVDIYISGDDDGIAVVRQIAVSIYDNNAVLDSDKLLTNNINAYWNKVFLLDKDVAVNPFAASFVPAGAGVYNTLDTNEGFLKGISLAPNKAAATSTVLAESNLASRAIAEGDVNLRYWRIQELADWFTDNYEAWVEPRWYNRLNADFSDHYVGSVSRCGAVSYASGCPSNSISSYSAENFRLAIDDEVKQIGGALTTAFSIAGIKWTISVPSNLFEGCDANQDHSSGALNTCNKRNMEYYEYKDSWVEYLDCNYDCYHVHDGCNGGSDGCADKNKCVIHWDERYILKNVPINVTLTDTKYKTFDVVTKSWIPYQFTFFVEINLVDDNACDDFGHVCSTQSGSALGSQTEPSIDVPSLLLYTCENTAGQTCETGAGCPVGKIAGSGTCGVGEVCCKNAPA